VEESFQFFCHLFIDLILLSGREYVSNSVVNNTSCSFIFDICPQEKNKIWSNWLFCTDQMQLLPSSSANRPAWNRWLWNCF
jgi:hypothetical protein